MASLWGEGGGEFDRLRYFLKSGIQAVRDTQPKTTSSNAPLLADGGAAQHLLGV